MAVSTILFLVVLAIAMGISGCSTAGPSRGSILAHTVQDMEGQDVPLGSYEGQVLLLVNVASKCGFTPQYEELEELYRTYGERGFVVLGFPANNFLGQEPGTNEEIRAFCKTTYGVTFPVFAKISVRGKDMAPLYKDLTSKEVSGDFSGGIKWNFTKFLVGRDGKVKARFGPRTKPTDPAVLAAIEEALADKAP